MAPPYQGSDLSRMSILSTYGPKGRDFTYISSDNRVSLWDTDINVRRHTYIEKQHLSHKYTCSAWHHGKKAELGELVVGCSDGVILIWDLARGVVARVIGDSSKGLAEVRDVAFSSDGKSIYACHEGESVVNEYKLEDGSLVRTLKGHKKGISKLSANPKAPAIALAGTGLKVMEVAGGNKRKLDAHFTGGAKCLTFTQCGRYLVCCAHDSQEVLLFDIHADASSTSPLCVLSCEDDVSKLITRSNKEQGYIDVLCVLEGGECVLHRVTIDTQASQQVKVVVPESRDLEVFDGFFYGNKSNEGNSCELQLAVKRTTSTDLRFLDVSLSDGRGGIVSEHTLMGDEIDKSVAQVDTAKGGNDARNAQSGPSVIGPLETGPSKRPVTETDEGEGDGLVGQAKRRRGEDDARDGEQEMTMEARLKRLSTEMKLMESAVSGNASSSSSSPASETPTSDSLVALLDQALQSGDDSLLEQCIGCEDTSVIEATAVRLPTGRIVPFMKRLVSKFEKRPSRGILLTRWLSAVLKAHTAFLIAVPDLSKQLASLSTMLEQRLATYTKLAALGGRLDLLLAQVSGEGGTSGPRADPKPARTVVVPEDDDD